MNDGLHTVTGIMLCLFLGAGTILLFVMAYVVLSVGIR